MNHDETTPAFPAGAQASEPPHETGPPVPPRPPSDLDTRWGMFDLLIFLLFAFAALVFLGSVMGFVAMRWLGIGWEEVQKLAQTNAVFVTLRTALWSALLMLYLFLQVRLRFGEPFWRGLGWRPLALRTESPAGVYLLLLVAGAALAMAMQFASWFIGRPEQVPIDALFRERTGAMLVMGLGILVAPLVEETVFRGYIYPALARRLGVAAGILLTGAIFGLIHAPQLEGAWGHVGLLTIVGILFTYARARTGTVWASYLLHLGYNGLLFLAFFAATRGFREFPPAP